MECKPYFFNGTPSWVKSRPTKYDKYQKRGLDYEKKIVKKVGDIFPDVTVLGGQWIYYPIIDRWRQCDFILLPDDTSLPVVVGECKLSYQEKAKDKILDCYCKAVETITERKTIGAQITRFIPEDLDRFFFLEDIFTIDQYGVILQP